jgi:cytochrome c oxidase assembly factor CtaG
LTTVAPPLLVAGTPADFVTARSGRPGALLRMLANPLLCLLAFIALLWLWHTPPLFDAASDDAALRAFQHVSFLAAGIMLAWPLAGPLPRLTRRLSGLRQLVYLASGELAVGVLGMWLAWYPKLVYAGYGSGAWGLSPGADQSLAGVVLLVVAEPLVVIEVAIVFIRVLSAQDSEDDELRA